MGIKHKEMIDHLFKFPDEVEEGVKLYYSEFGFGRGRVDLVGVDKEGNLCIVEVKIRKPNRKTLGKQLRKYYVPLRRLFGMMGVDKNIRMFLATPKGVEHLYDIKPSKPDYVGSRQGIPTAREIYGGQVTGSLPQKREGK